MGITGESCSRNVTGICCDELAVMRVIDREQAKVVAGFGSTTRANARLLKLTRAGTPEAVLYGSRRRDEA